MKNLILYRILSYILLILAGFLAVFILMSLAAALVSPLLLLILFVLACVVIYSYTSWRFLTRGVDYNQPCKPILRDLIRVNAIVSILFALYLITAYIILSDPKLFETALHAAATQASEFEGSDAESMKNLMPKMLMAMLKFMIIYGILILIHSFFTFRLLKQYRHIFEPPGDGPTS